MLQDARPCDEAVLAGSNNDIKAELEGTVMLEQVGSGKKLKLEWVLYVPGFAKNILSVPKLNEKGHKVTFSHDGATFTTRKGKNFMRTTTESGKLYYLEFMTMEVAPKTVSKTMDIVEAHERYAYLSESPLRETLKRLGITPTGKMCSCDGRARAKARQKAIVKQTLTKATFVC
jgi:hypothetical protein